MPRSTLTRGGGGEGPSRHSGAPLRCLNSALLSLEWKKVVMGRGRGTGDRAELPREGEEVGVAGEQRVLAARWIQ